jgi:hypothetical protein
MGWQRALANQGLPTVPPPPAAGASPRLRRDRTAAQREAPNHVRGPAVVTPSRRAVQSRTVSLRNASGWRSPRMSSQVVWRCVGERALLGRALPCSPGFPTLSCSPRRRSRSTRQPRQCASTGTRLFIVVRAFAFPDRKVVGHGRDDRKPPVSSHARCVCGFCTRVSAQRVRGLDVG